MSMQLVNGVLCLNCSDVERAKKAGLSGSVDAQDPLHPSAVNQNRGDTSSAGGASGASASDPSAGAPSSADGPTAITPTDAPVLGVNQPLAGGDRGTQLNLLT